MTDRSLLLVRAALTFVLAFMVAPLVRAQAIQYATIPGGTYLPLDGATVPAKVNIRVLPCQTAVPVSFTLDTKGAGTESICPIELGGDDVLQNFAVGVHTLTASSTAINLTAKFTVGTVPAPPVPLPPSNDNGTATINWTASTENVDGTPYTNPAGYVVTYGLTPVAGDYSITLSDPLARSIVIPGLTDGTWYFRVKALSTELNINSPPSNAVSLVVVTNGPLPPPPVACTVSAWMSGTPGAWSACVAGKQTRSVPQTRVVVIPASNGGAACPALAQTITETQTCVVPPPPATPMVVAVVPGINMSPVFGISGTTRGTTVLGFVPVGKPCTGATVYSYRGAKYYRFTSSDALWWQSTATSAAAVACQ